MRKYYKLARPDGFDFHTGKTINYRESIGKIVSPPETGGKTELCTPTVIHASKNILDALRHARIPLSAYIVEGKPEVSDDTKSGFKMLKVLEEIPESDFEDVLGFKYKEAINPLDPRKITPLFDADALRLLGEWDSVWESVWDSMRDSMRDSVLDSVWDSVRGSVRESVWDSVWGSVRESVWDSVLGSVRESVWDSMRDSESAYVGSLFPKIKKWLYVEHKSGQYPFRSNNALLERGLVPVTDGTKWYLVHPQDGKAAEIIWSGKLK